MPFLVPVQTYMPNWPYHFLYDRIPISTIIEREDALNAQVETDAQILRDSVGTAGTLANRLNVSLNANGTLKTTAVDNTLHNIGNHADGNYLGTDYVRMTLSERNKLTAIAISANLIYLRFDAPNVTFTSGTVEILDSDSIVWQQVSGMQLKAHTSFPVSALRQVNYDLTPVPTTFIPDYQNYKVNSLATPYISGTLRVYINGFRLTESTTIYVPNRSATPTFALNGFTSSPGTGTFSLTNPITSTDIIRIDFELTF